MVSLNNNAGLGKMIQKLTLDNDNTYPNDVIVSWAISIKNALQTCYGFRPNQLVFRISANLASNLVDLPPPMKDVSCADLLVIHLMEQEMLLLKQNPTISYAVL